MTPIRTSISRLLPKSRFARGVTVLASGTAAGQAIVVLASPILTRLYTPEDFGVLAVYASFLGIVTVAANLRYQLAIPLPRSDGSAANILALSLVCVAGVTALVAAIVALLGCRIVAWTNTPMLTPYLWLLPVGVALGGAYQAFNYWAVRNRAFTRIAGTKLQQGIGSVATQIGLGLAHFGPLGLVLGQVVGQAAGLTNLVRSAWREDRDALHRIGSKRIRWAARRYRQFPYFSTWSSLVDKAGTQLPLIMFAALFSPMISGLYFLADRAMKMPMGLLGQAIGQVFHSSAARARRAKALNSLTLYAFSGLVRIGLGPVILIAITAPELFGLVFGAEWREAGAYVQWLAPWFVVLFIVSPLTTLVSVLEKQVYGLIFHVSVFTLHLAGIIVGFVIGSATAAVALYAVAGLLMWTMLGMWLLRAAGVAMTQWVQVFITECLRVAPIAMALWWVSGMLVRQDPFQMGNVLVALCTFVAVGGVLVWRALPLLTKEPNYL